VVLENTWACFIEPNINGFMGLLLTSVKKQPNLMLKCATRRLHTKFKSNMQCEYIFLQYKCVPSLFVSYSTNSKV
jgi:hypothetical protein